MPAIKSKTFIALLLLAAAFLVMHAPVLLGAKVYVNQWIFRNHAPFPAPDPSVLNPLNTSSDFITHYSAHRFFIAQALKQGFLPLWNPHVFGGFPVFANGSSTAFSPLNAFLLAFHPYVAYKFFLIFTFFAGGAAMFLYLTRCLGLTAAAGLAGALTLILSPFLVQNIDSQGLLGFVWSFPCALIACEAGITKRLFSIALLALVLFLAALTSHIHVVVNTVFLVSFYRIFILSKKEGIVQSVLSVAASGVLFLGLAGFILYPTHLFMRESQWAPAGGPGAVLKLPLWLVTSLYPIIEKMPYYGIALDRIGADRFGAADALNIGFLPYLFSLGAVFFLFSRAMPRRLKGFVVLNLIFFVLSLGILPAILRGAGGLAAVMLMRFGQVYLFSCAVLCAFMFDAVMRSAAFTKTFSRFVSVVFAVLVLPVTIASSVLTFFPSSARHIFFQIAGQAGFLDKPGAADRFGELFELTARYLSLRSSFVGLPFLITVLLIGLLHWMPSTVTVRERYMKAAVLCLLAVELFATGFQLRPVPVELSKVFPETRTTAFLKNDPETFRVLAIQGEKPPKGGLQKYVLKPNLAIPYGLHDAGGQESILNAKYLYFGQKYLSNRPDAPFRNNGILDFEDVNVNLASLLNVKYILAGRPLSKEGLTPVLEADGLTIYKNANVLPRIFFTRRIAAAPQDRDALFRQLMDAPPAGEPLVYVKNWAGEEAGNAGNVSGGEPIRPDFTVLPSGGARVKVSVPSRGLLVYTDNSDPGWKVIDNGRPAPILEADGLFQAVLLEPGEHDVIFEYAPAYFYKGAALSAAFLAVLIALFLFSRRKCSH